MSNNIDSAALLTQLRSMASQAGIPPAKEVTALTEGGTQFTQVLKQSLESVNQRSQTASKLRKAFELGDPNVELSQVMIEAQKARISFETLSQVRKRLVSAYKEIMSMPV